MPIPAKKLSVESAGNLAQATLYDEEGDGQLGYLTVDDEGVVRFVVMDPDHDPREE